MKTPSDKLPTYPTTTLAEFAHAGSRDGYAASQGSPTEAWKAGLRRNARQKRARLTLGKIFVPILLLIVWELLSEAVVPVFFISSPSLVSERLVQWTLNGTVLLNARVTFTQALLGFSLGSFIGVTLAIVLGRIDVLGKTLDPILTALYAIPRVALAPLFILWFGIGSSMKVYFTALIVFFLVFNTTITGIRAVSRPQINVLRVMGASRTQVLRKVILPSAGVWFFAGLRLSVPYALVGAVVAELIAGNQGIGFLLRRAQGQLDTTGVFAGLTILMAMSLFLTLVVSIISRRALLWEASSAEVVA